MKSLKQIGCLQVAVMCGLLACAAGMGAQKVTADEAGLKKVTTANNRFAVEFYRNLTGAHQGENIFVSPESISVALAMTFEGASGQTRQQMADVLHLAMSDGERQTGYAALMNAVKADAKSSYKLSMANALWGQKDFKFLPSFTGAINKSYGGGFATVDYVGGKTAAVARINKWVEDQTAQKIKNLVHDEDVNALTRLILTNAIYFKGDWQHKFMAGMTQTGPFHLASGKDVEAKLMHQKGSFGFVREGGVTALEMPYAGDDLAMLVVLPDGQLSELEAKLTAEQITALRGKMDETEVDVMLPRFTFAQRYQLADALVGMGMKDAFDENAADFSGMTGSKGLYIAKVIHQSFIEVNEQGSEAAAATAVIMATKSAMISRTESFRADHPFLFLIVHKATGSILFLGRVENPGA